MKVLVSPYGILEPAMWLMGYQPFALALYDNPDLVEALIARITSIYVPIAEAVLDMAWVGGLFTGDDMGFKTATMIAPEHLREYVFPLPQTPGRVGPRARQSLHPARLRQPRGGDG
ncbi:MAG: hypothetical protein M5R40_24050 [Anaerolineae bacterium]|nr:hypothetical protein [Anaerolineae bacterium]